MRPELAPRPVPSSRTLLHVTAVLVILACATLPPAAAAPAGARPATPRFETIASDAQHVRVELTLDALPLVTVEAGGERFTRVELEGGEIEGAAGEPARPILTRLVAIPRGARARVAAAAALEEARYAGHRLLPVSDADGGEVAPDATAYGRRGFGDVPLAEVGEPVRLRDLTVVPLRLRPVAFDPSRDLLRLTRRLAVELEIVAPDGTGPAPGPTPPLRVPASFDRIYRELVVNDDGGARVIVPGTYLVICSAAAGVADRLQPLLDWRQRQGFVTRLATTAETGTAASQIKSFIQGIYDDPESALEYVVLVGDASGTYGVPCFYETMSGYSGEGDNPYVQLAGGDDLPDAHIGRLSFSTLEELERIVNKILGYEMTPPLGEPEWFTRACVVGDPYDSGESCVTTGKWLKERLIDVGYTEIDTVWTSPFVSQMLTALNRGDTIFGYRGFYGMSGWTAATTYQLQNGWKMPFVVALTCDTGSFASGTSRSESFLRAGSGTSDPDGGIGAIGTSTWGTHTRYNNCMYYGIWHGLLERGLHTMGAALTWGKINMHLNYDMSEPQTAAIWSHWNNLMGDPAVDVWTAFPVPLEVAHPASIPAGTNAVSVTVAAAGQPLAGARVCLRDPSSGAQAVGITDTGGEIELLVASGAAGPLQLTVTAHDRHAYLADIAVVAGEPFAGVGEVVVDDDELGESYGNADGVVNPLESIELRVAVENHGPAALAGVTATLACDDPRVTIIDGIESYGTIPAGAAVWCADDFGFQLAGDWPHAEPLRLELTVQAGLDAWRSIIELEVASVELAARATTVTGAGGDGILHPGETGQLSVELANVGGHDAAAVTATLRAPSPWLAVTDSIGSYGPIPVGAAVENVLDRFGVAADPATFEGYLAGLTLVVDCADGVRDTCEATLTIGERTTDDPVGPDAHGYHAFDDTDVGYPEAPAYDWVEIDPSYGGAGSEVPLGDYGTYEDCSALVDLPFNFRYYGTTYGQATVCSNGWLAMGATYLSSYRNWTLPGAGGPAAMLAAFWDDLREVSGSGHVYTWHDAATHRYIVEWSRLRNDAGYTQTFEIILYDPAHYPTETGDGIILFQYESVQNYDPTNGYATVGIESPDELDGLLYTYWNRYAGGAASLAPGRAIKFLPLHDGPLGTLAGVVRNASAGGTPVPGAEIRIVEADRALVTGEEGRYEGRVAPGQYTVVASHASFEPDTVRTVVIVEDEVTPLDFALVDIAPPIVSTTPPPWTDDTIGPYPVPVTIVEYSGLPTRALHYRVNGGAFAELELEPQGGDAYLAEIPGQPYQSAVEFYVEARDGLGLETLDPPDAPDSLFAFWVVPIQIVLDDPFETAQGWTAGVPGDNATTGIWVREEPVGTWNGSEPVQPEYDHTPEPGEICFVTGNALPGQAAGTNDVDSGKTTLMSPLFDLTGLTTVLVDYWVWYSNDTGSGPGEDVWEVEVTADGSTWVDLENTHDSTHGWVERQFTLEDSIELTDRVQLRFIASDYGLGSIVEAAVDDFRLWGMVVTVDAGGAVPGTAAITRLEPCSPNPFNPRTWVRFQTARRGEVELGVYDVGGRLVRVLVQGSRPAGAHRVSWDGRNGAGQPVASGVYYLRLLAPGATRTGTMTLVR
ncbi:MAG: C25 family cysteine peptidase [Candidatus Eiseniibacteriota bacterium]|jgi:hypothetical protein